MMPTFRTRAVLAVWAILSASAAGDVSAQAQTQRATPIRVRLPGNLRWMWMDSVATDPVSVAASPAMTYTAASAVLQELKVPLSVNEPQNGVLGNGGFTMVRLLGRERLSKYLSCGTGNSGAYADVRRVTMALFFWLDSTGQAQSTVKVGMLAGAQDLEGVSKNALLCGSTGTLETFLTEEIRKRAVMP